MTTETNTAFINHSTEWITTGTVNPLEKFREAASLRVSHSMSTLFDKNFAVRLTNTTESPYTIRKNTDIAEFSVVTPEQSKFMKPVDTAILSLFPEVHPDLTTFLNEPLKTNKLEKQSNTIWFPTPEKPGKIEDHTPMQTRKLRKIHELKVQEKLNPEDDTETQKKLFKRFE